MRAMFRKSGPGRKRVRKKAFLPSVLGVSLWEASTEVGRRHRTKSMNFPSWASRGLRESWFCNNTILPPSGSR